MMDSTYQFRELKSYLMPCDGLFLFRTYESGLRFPEGWVGNCNVETVHAGSSAPGFHLPYVSLYYLDFPFKRVEGNVLLCKGRESLLEFKEGDVRVRILLCEEQSQNP